MEPVTVEPVTVELVAAELASMAGMHVAATEERPVQAALLRESEPLADQRPPGALATSDPPVVVVPEAVAH